MLSCCKQIFNDEGSWELTVEFFKDDFYNAIFTDTVGNYLQHDTSLTQANLVNTILTSWDDLSAVSVKSINLKFLEAHPVPPIEVDTDDANWDLFIVPEGVLIPLLEDILFDCKQVPLFVPIPIHYHISKHRDKE